jgi:phosphoribosylcarboxyaminoimidazole (NCAIR) mutase
MANSQSINSGNSYPDFNNLQSYINKLTPYSSDDYASTFPGYSANLPSYVAAQTSSPVPDSDEQQRKLIALEQARLPYTLSAIDQLSRNQSNLSFDQMVKSAPLIDWAAQQASNRSIAGTKEVSYFKDFLPTAKQNRALAGSTAFAQEAEAIKNQQLAANQFGALNFARSYARG